MRAVALPRDPFSGSIIAVRLLRSAVTLALCIAPATAFAQMDPRVTLTINDQAKMLLGNELQVAEDQIEALIQERFNQVYRLADVQEFLRVSANAQALSNKGLGVDYAADPSLVIFGAAIAASADAGDADLQSIAEPDAALRAGAGAQLALMAGLNLSVIGLPSVTAYANGLYHPWSSGDLSGEFYNVGGHVQISLVDPKGVGLEWMGLKVTSGIEISRMVLELEDEQASSAPIAVGGNSYQIRSVANGTLRLEQTAFNIPFEATTGLTVASLVSVYGGIGLDLMFGGARIDAALDATMEADNPVMEGETLDVGTARIEASEEGDPNKFFPRFLVGAQVHLGPVNVFGQLNLGINDVAVSVAAGARVSI